MRSRNLFLLVYLLWSCFGTLNAKRNETCRNQEDCDREPDATAHFLQCVGLPPTDTGKDHMHRLKNMLEATMDVYTFMRSSLVGVPLLSLKGALELNFRADPLQNEDLVHMWLEVTMKPLLKSVTKQFLSCLSTKNFSCSTYQMVVREFSHHFSEMSPVRQKWIYTFFMYPFLSGDRVKGCVNRNETSEEWLMKNFGYFRAMARMRDFSTLNMVFSGLEVLHLLSPAQKAELMMRPEVAGLDNGTLSLVFHSLMTGGHGPPPTAGPGWGHNWTTPGYPPAYHPKPTYDPYKPPSPHNGLREVVNGLMMAVNPVTSFVHEFVSFTKERPVSEIKSTTLAQFLLNMTLAQLADMYRPLPERPEFDPLNVTDWYQHVVMPLLRRFLPNDQALMHHKIRLAFHEVFYLDNGKHNETSEEMDVCSITLDKRPCGLTDAVQNVASVMHCAARTNLTMSEATIMKLIGELSGRLQVLMKEFSTANFTELVYDFKEIFREAHSPPMTKEHLNDPEFIRLWFKVKLMPLLPNIPIGLLSCLSTKNFTCPVYQTIVKDLSHHMSFMHADPMFGRNIYQHFIFPFLMNHNTTDPQCVASANSSAEWLIENFGFFSRFASITDFYKLNQNFSGLDVLRLLTPNQTAELLLLPLPTPPEKDVVIDRVFAFLLESPVERNFMEVLHYLVELARTVDPPCGVFRQIFERLYAALPSLPPHLEPVTWAGIDELRNIAPEECVPANITCPVTQFNATRICRGVDSSVLESHLNTSMEVSCNFTLETYACAQLGNFTAHQLVSLLKCDLPGNSSHSKMLWKMLLTKVSFVLDPALDILADMPMVVPSAMEILDIIGEIRVSILTDEELMNSSVIMTWFSRRLSGFLPFASGRFLHCLIRRNLTCYTYQQILKTFNHRFDNMTSKQQQVVFREFVLPFLTLSGQDCLTNNSAEWLMRNLGAFSQFLTIRELLHFNPQFRPLEVLRLLTPKQIVELLASPPPDLPARDVIINTIFDHLTQSDDERFRDFLSILTRAPLGNLSCSSFRTLFNRLDVAMLNVSRDVQSSITYTKMALSRHIPLGCIIYGGQCNITMTNETDICVGVNSTMLQLHLDSGRLNGSFCNFPVEEFACASLSGLKAEDLAMILACNRSSNSSSSRPVWKLLLSKASHVLDQALDLLTNKTLDPRNPAVSVILDAIREIRLDTFGSVSLNDPALIQLWFNRRLLPLLPAISADFLSCLTTRGLNCSTYQQIVKILSRVQPHMTLPRQMFVFTDFIKPYLSRQNSTDPSCRLNTNSSGDWLQRNLGGFSVFANFSDLTMLYTNFSGLEALPLLTVRQLAEMSSTPGQLNSAAQVARVMNHVPSQQLPSFFDIYSPTISAHQNLIPPPVRSAMLQVVFDRANLSNITAVSDPVVQLWINTRLPPLLVNLSPDHVALFFGILAVRTCSIEQQGVEDLNLTISSLSQLTQNEIHNHIIQALRGPQPLRCYTNGSFYIFLERSFLQFQFPNLTTVLSVIPANRTHQLLNSMPLSHLGDLLRHRNVVDNDAALCVIYDNYIQTPLFLQTEWLPVSVRRPTLRCIWPTALSSSNRSEVNNLFTSLRNYTAFLTRDLISPSVTQNASCLAFQQFILVLGDFNYTDADFVRQDVFNTIATYLNAASAPRCYNPSDPELNSTAWFVEYIGPFTPFLTLEALQTFGSAQFIQVFAVNLDNIALLNNSNLPLNLTDYYTELIYQQDSNFNPLILPVLWRCVVPGPAFSQLNATESMIILYNLTTLCTNVDPQVAAALAGNLGDNIDASSIFALGNESSGLSTGQIEMISPQVLLAALSVLGVVPDWNTGQARAIFLSLMSSGMMQFNNASSLLMLGSLVVGVPSTTVGSITGTELITASQNPVFLGHLTSAPLVVQQTFVTQIISVNSSSESIIENVPDELGAEIPRVLLLGFSSTTTVITRINRKRWRKQQAQLFFEVIGVESVTTQLGGPDSLSSLVLQGFTCTSVRTFPRAQVRRLIRACRRTGRNRVRLVETQLTCMYNYIRVESDVTNFSLFPHDMLLYYDYSLVPQASCRSYFDQLGSADFSVISTNLGYIRPQLFTNAQGCLGITNTSLTQDNISVLGNMCCILDASFIRNSHSSILDRLMNCADLTASQATAVETLLLSGTTQFGNPSTWDGQTLTDLGMLPLYLSSNFYDEFDRRTKRRFLRVFLRVLRANRVSRRRRRMLKRQIRISIRNSRSKRSIENECTVGIITQVTISDEAFPFDYDDINQFNCCLSATTVKDNLGAITDKVDDEDYLRIVLSKLREAYAANSSIPESQVQLLGAASRVATTEDINKWTITVIDTLSSLMDSSNGEWDPSLAKAIITKYLSIKGNKLGSAELNVIGGTNLCSLDVDVLRNITQQSLRDADALDVSNCTQEKKSALFVIAREAFTTTTTTASRSQTISASSYQLTEPFVGGADLNYVRSLSASNISMDLATFTGLDDNVVLALTVSEVQGLLGSNLPDLRAYENESLVQNWISRQAQSDLDTLGVGLTGGRADSSTTASPTATTAGSATTSSSAATSTTGSVTTTNSATTSTGGSATTSTGGSATTSTGGSATTSTGGSATTSTGGSATTSTGGSATTSTGGSATTSTAGSATTSTTSSVTTTSSSATTTTESVTTTTAGSTATTESSGTRLRADAGFSILVLLVLLVTSQHILV